MTEIPSPQPAHTPGPWRVCENAPSLIEADIGHADGLPRTIAQALDPIPHIGDATVNANARLIAAAPELLMALQMLYAETAEYIELNHLGGMDNQSMQLARAAIAKATGAQA